MVSISVYATCLNIFNLFVIVAGAGLIYVGVSDVDPDYADLTNELMSGAFLVLPIATGVILFLCGIFGCVSTRRALKLEDEGESRCSKSLCVYGFLILTVFILITVIFAATLVSFNYLNDAGSTGFDPSSDFDSAVNATLTQLDADVWIRIQDRGSCCGWGDVTDSLATGAACGALGNATGSCREVIISDYLDELFKAFLVSLVVWLIMLMVVISICGLGCSEVAENGYELPSAKPNAAAVKYERILYLFNLILFGLGVGIMYTMFGLDTDLNELSSAFLGGGYVGVAIAVAFFLVVVSILGCVAAYRADKNIEEESCSKTLGLYGLIVFITLILGLVVFGIAVTTYFYLSDESSAGYDAENPDEFDVRVLEAINALPADTWVKIQDNFQCCGWGLEVEEGIATGAACATATTSTPLTSTDSNTFITTCRGVLISAYNSELLVGTGVILVVNLMLLIVMMSVCCLSFLKPKDAQNAVPLSG